MFLEPSQSSRSVQSWTHSRLPLGFSRAQQQQGTHFTTLSLFFPQGKEGVRYGCRLWLSAARHPFSSWEITLQGIYVANILCLDPRIGTEPLRSDNTYCLCGPSDWLNTDPGQSWFYQSSVVFFLLTMTGRGGQPGTTCHQALNLSVIQQNSLFDEPALASVLCFSP